MRLKGGFVSLAPHLAVSVQQVAVVSGIILHLVDFQESVPSFLF